MGIIIVPILYSRYWRNKEVEKLTLTACKGRARILTVKTTSLAICYTAYIQMNQWIEIHTNQPINKRNVMGVGAGMTSLRNRAKLEIGVGQSGRTSEGQMGSKGRLCTGGSPLLELMEGLQGPPHTHSSEHVQATQ